MTNVLFGRDAVASGKAPADRSQNPLEFDPTLPHGTRTAQMARSVVFLGKQAELALADVGISDAQYRMLSLLSRGTISPSAAATLLSVSPPSVTSLIEGLLERGLVVRCPGTQDRRRVELSLTEAGSVQLSAADGAVAQRLEEIAGFASDQQDRQASFDALVWWAENLQGLAAALTL